MRTASEASAIAAFRRALGTGRRGEDVELFGLGRARLAVSIDTLVASTDVPPAVSMRDAARKAVASCVSDFAAKGVRPSAAVVSVVLARGIPQARVGQISRGTADAAREFGVRIIGGDTNGGEDTAITVCAVGAAPRRVPRRSGARAGDAVMVTGPFGYAAAGLAVALSTKRLRGPAAFVGRAARAFARPSPPLGFCARSAASFTSSMDSSDGLAATLCEMASQSGARFEIDELPAARGLGEFAALNGLDARELVLYGGEEYETVFTCPPAARARLARRAARMGVGLCEIGRVARGRGVYARDGRGRFRVEDRGWQHLRGSAHSRARRHNP